MPSAVVPLLETLAPLLRTRRFGRSARGFETVGSTNTEAAAWASEGAPDGALVVAEFQAEGRGRFGRTWEAAAGANLTFSLVLRPALAPEHLALLPLAAAVGVAEAAERFVAPADAAIKWPNDVLVEGRKVCGLLLEASTACGTTTVILGIGLNVNQTAFPPEHADRAGSLALAAGRPLPRADVLAVVLAAVEEAYDALHRPAGPASLLARYEARLAGRGAPVTLHPTAGAAPVDGVLDGVTAGGALRVRTDDGVRIFHAGDVSSRPPAAPR